MAVQYIWKVLPRASQRGPERQAQTDAGRCPRQAPGDPAAHHQRGLRRPDLYYFITKRTYSVETE